MLILPQFNTYTDRQTHIQTHMHTYWYQLSTTPIRPPPTFALNPFLATLFKSGLKFIQPFQFVQTNSWQTSRQKLIQPAHVLLKDIKDGPLLSYILGLGLNILSSEMTSTAPASLHPAEISIKIIQEYHSCFQGNLLTSALGILGTEVQKRTNVEEKALLTWPVLLKLTK